VYEVYIFKKIKIKNILYNGINNHKLLLGNLVSGIQIQEKPVKSRKGFLESSYKLV
jgi:hypothetical protein